uniref:Uncharacterized protein n=1 Tax=Oryza punctata TaxID=4537 RepID=A0A0E0KZL6_ORYPU
MAAFLEHVFQEVQPPLLPTPMRQAPKGRVLNKSPTKLAQAGRSARLAKKAAARLAPAKPGERAQEVLMKKAGLLPAHGKKTDDAMTNYVKLFKQPLSTEVIDAFSALMIGRRSSDVC